ncbi:MAG: lysophospholipid acyltransferase family protein [Patescibacteria group bacterium]
MNLYYVSPLLLQKLIWVPTRIILAFFGNLTIKDIDNTDLVKKNVIFACNHSSEIDPFIVPASLSFFSKFSPLFYPVREKKFYDQSGWRKHLFGGRFINLWGGFPVYVGLHNFEKALEDHVRILKNGGSLCVFPEGGRSHNGYVQPAKGGVAYLSDASNCPIIPVAISGVFKTSLIDFLLGNRRIRVQFGKPIFPEELRIKVPAYPSEDKGFYRERAQYVMSKIVGMLPEPSIQNQVADDIHLENIVQWR